MRAAACCGGEAVSLGLSGVPHAGLKSARWGVMSARAALWHMEYVGWGEWLVMGVLSQDI